MLGHGQIECGELIDDPVDLRTGEVGYARCLPFEFDQDGIRSGGS